MAKKKDEKVESPKTGEVNAASTEPTENENIKLSDEEKVALEVQQKSTEGSPYSGKFKLKDPETQYAEKDFTLTGDQAKELPQEPSGELLARIRSGFIVKE